MFDYLSSCIISKILGDIKLGLTIADLGGEIIWHNQRTPKLLGWDQQMEKKSLLDFHEYIKQQFVLDKVQEISSEEWYSLLELDGRYIESSFTRTEIPGVFNGIVIVTSDVTEREQMLRVIKEAAFTDELTGLYNRNYFEQVFQNLACLQQPFGLIMFDVNALKYVNDHYGHEAGDQLIIQAADLIKKSSRKTDDVFRYGGDEFVVIVRGGDHKVIQSIIARIRKKGSGNVLQGRDGFGVNLSIGSCLSTEIDDMTNPREIIHRADQNMYEDKKRFYAENSHLQVRKDA